MNAVRRRATLMLAVAAATLALTTGCWPFSSAATPKAGTPPAATTASPATTAPTAAPPSTTPPASPPTAAAGLSGTWHGTWANDTPDHSTGTFTLTWTQHGANLSGSITIAGTPCLDGGSITGSSSGSKITFGVVHGQVSVDYSGTVAGTSMSGMYATDCGNARGNWSATKK